MSESQTKQRLKAAVIGAGPHGLRIVGVLAEMPGSNWRRWSTAGPRRWPRRRCPAGVARLESSDELFARGDIDLVCIATNGPSHAAFGAGRDGCRACGI